MKTLFKNDSQKHIHTSNREDWISPPEIVEPGRSLMAGIKLDPASSQNANQVIRANKIYTKIDNGLRFAWRAESIWLNPPYGKIRNQSKVAIWAEKMLNDFTMGYFKMGIFICHITHLEHDPVQRLGAAGVIMPTRGRISFLNPRTLEPEGKGGSGSLIIGVGFNPKEFRAAYAAIGTVYQAV